MSRVRIASALLNCPEGGFLGKFSPRKTIRLQHCKFISIRSI